MNPVGPNQDARQQRGRPIGAKRAELAGWMAARNEFTMRDVVSSLGWPMGAAGVTLHRAIDAGEVRMTGTVRIPDAKRPVALYERASAQFGFVPLSNLMRVWS